MDPMFPEKMDASLDGSVADSDVLPSNSDFGLFLPTTSSQGLTESDIAKNIKCNVMMTDVQDDKSTIFSFVNDNSPSKKETFAIDDHSLLMVENSLDATVKDGIPSADALLHRTNDPLSLIDPYSSAGSDEASLGIELLEDPASGRGTPILFRKFEVEEKGTKGALNYNSPFLHKMNQDDIIDNFADLPESRCVKPSEVHSQPIVIESKASSDKSKQRKPSGSRKTCMKPKIAIQDQTLLNATMPNVTSSFIININKSSANLSPQIITTQKIDLLQSGQSITPQLSRLRMKHPIITGILGIPPKGPVWNIPNLFGSSFVNNSNGESACVKQENMHKEHGIQDHDIRIDKIEKKGLSKHVPISMTSSKVLPVGPISNKKDVQSKQSIQGILVTDKTTFVSDRTGSTLDSQSAFSTKNTMAEIAIKKLLTAKTTELYKGSNLQLTLPMNSETDGEAHGKTNIKTKASLNLAREDDVEEPDVDSPHLNQTLVDNYMKNWKPTGKFSCTQCPYSSVTRNYLFRHWVMKHTEIKPYQCPYCDVDMGYKDGITRHQGSSHRGKPKNVIVDLSLENKLVEEFAEIFGEIILDPMEKAGMDDTANLDSETNELEVIDSTIAKFNDEKIPSKDQQKVSSQSTLASIALPILPAIMNKDSIAISAAVALQSAVLSLTQAGAANTKTSSARSETVCSNVHPKVSTQLKNVDTPLIVISDDANIRLAKKGSETHGSKLVNAQKRPLLDSKPLLLKVARVESLSEVSKVVRGNVPSSATVANIDQQKKDVSVKVKASHLVKTESSHTSVKS